MKNAVKAQDFFETCEKYAEKLGAIDTERLISKKAWGISLSFRICRAELVYFRKGAFPAPKNSMCCRVFINKNSPIFFMLSDIQAELGINDFRAVYFSKINDDTLDICVRSLTEVLGEYVKQIEESLLTSLDDSLYENLFDEYRREYNLKPDDIDFSLIGDEEKYDYFYFLNLQYNRERLLISRFTEAEPYIYLVMGSPEVALYKYEKSKTKLSKYEQKLMEFLKTPAAEGFSIFKPEYAQMAKTVAKKSNYILQTETDKKLPLYWLIMFPPFAVIFCLMGLIINFLLTRGAVESFFAPWYFGAIPAFLCAMFGGIVFRKPLMRWLEGKKAGVKLAQDEMINSKGMEKFIRIFFVIVVIFSTVVSLLSFTQGVRIYEDRFDSLTAFGFMCDEFYYKDIETVYHIDARYNFLDERIERGSYIVCMKDGTFLDFDSVTNDKKTKEKFLPFLEKENIEIVYLDSDRDLPFELFEE